MKEKRAYVGANPVSYPLLECKADEIIRAKINEEINSSFGLSDIVCSMWCTDGFEAGDYCSRGEEGVYVPDDNCIQDQEGYL